MRISSSSTSMLAVGARTALLETANRFDHRIAATLAAPQPWSAETWRSEKLEPCDDARTPDSPDFPAARTAPRPGRGKWEIRTSDGALHLIESRNLAALSVGELCAKVRRPTVDHLASKPIKNGRSTGIWLFITMAPTGPMAMSLKRRGRIGPTRGAGASTWCRCVRVGRLGSARNSGGGLQPATRPSGDCP
jgi:hypothetical protein